MARASKDKDTTATERLAEALAEQKRLTAGWKACEAARSAFEQRAAKAQARALARRLFWTGYPRENRLILQVGLDTPPIPIQQNMRIL